MSLLIPCIPLPFLVHFRCSLFLFFFISFIPIPFLTHVNYSSSFYYSCPLFLFICCLIFRIPLHLLTHLLESSSFRDHVISSSWFSQSFSVFHVIILTIAFIILHFSICIFLIVSFIMFTFAYSCHTRSLHSFFLLFLYPSPCSHLCSVFSFSVLVISAIPLHLITLYLCSCLVLIAFSNWFFHFSWVAFSCSDLLHLAI